MPAQVASGSSSPVVDAPAVAVAPGGVEAVGVCRAETAASNPDENAASDGSTDLPKARIGASNCSRVNGSAPDPATAPNSEALITEPAASAMAAKSAATRRWEARPAAASSSSSSTRPSPIDIRSSIE